MSRRNLRIALVSTPEAHGQDQDLPPLLAACADAGVAATIADWDDASVDWSAFDLALVRSPWNYVRHLAAFLAWADRAGAQTLLLNPPELLRWNTDKSYLLDLAASGVPVIESRILRVGQPLSGMPDAAEVVVKPTVGGGARGCKRLRRADTAAIDAHVRSLHGQGFDVLIQPYLASVDARGETALIHFDGIFSHAIEKGPLLALDAEPTLALFAPEKIRARHASDAERAVAAACLAVVPGGPLAYARVDLIEDADGQPRVLELEITEPSLFFDTAPGSAARLVGALLSRLSSGSLSA